LPPTTYYSPGSGESIGRESWAKPPRKGYIEEIRTKFVDKQIALLPSYGEEVKGGGLLRVARDLCEMGQLKL
jgi:hypothetical protein